MNSNPSAPVAVNHNYNNNTISNNNNNNNDAEECHPPEPTPTRSNNRQKNRKPTKGIGKGRPLKTEGPKKRRPKTVTTMKAAEIAHKYVTREMGVTPTVITFANKQLSSMSISDAPQDPAPSSATFAQEKTYFHL
ncbi:hypothetical protein CRE_14785 [Caenorhabditis remanei]|uniref:Uncharacterized protein n=1 Tax=Caenorhabditis remanei TaxID=31234 RepID=E3MRP6_CAERE|nr:hypothetical protein CRE_14785 [Caenorhabditis remanei]